jgi:hypothetical protein
MFWYFCGLVLYDKEVFSGIGLSLRRHRRQEYLDATLKSC